jgi:hypothetical protein
VQPEHSRVLLARVLARTCTVCFRFPFDFLSDFLDFPCDFRFLRTHAPVFPGYASSLSDPTPHVHKKSAGDACHVTVSALSDIPRAGRHTHFRRLLATAGPHRSMVRCGRSTRQSDAAILGPGQVRGTRLLRLPAGPPAHGKEPVLTLRTRSGCAWVGGGWAVGGRWVRAGARGRRVCARWWSRDAAARRARDVCWAGRSGGAVCCKMAGAAGVLHRRVCAPLRVRTRCTPSRWGARWREGGGCVERERRARCDEGGMSAMARRAKGSAGPWEGNAGAEVHSHRP